MIVWKSTHDAVVQGLRDQLAMAEAEKHRLLADLDEYRDRERRTFERQMLVTAPPVVHPKKEPTEVDSAIALRSAADRSLRAYLTQYARKMRLEGMSEEDIAERILKGEQVSEEEGVDE